MIASFELLFVRHGEGEHMLDLPRSLERKHPRLTERGCAQVQVLKEVVQVTDRDLVLASPTPRTIETADILCRDARPRKYVCPMVGPRMFPQDPRFMPLLCDDLLEPEVVDSKFPEYQLHPSEVDSEFWSGINRIRSVQFAQIATELLRWCKEAMSPRVILISHDGTIHNYRQFFGRTQSHPRILPRTGRTLSSPIYELTPPSRYYEV